MNGRPDPGKRHPLPPAPTVMPAIAHRTPGGARIRRDRSRGIPHGSTLLLLLIQLPAAASALEATPSEPRAHTASVQRYVLQGGVALPPDEVARVMADATGPEVTLPRITAALARLQNAYRERGFPRATVRLPRQLLDRGLLEIVVTEGPQAPPTPTPQPAASPDPSSTPPAPPERRFEVQRYEIQGNTVLPPAVAQAAFTNAVGPEVTLSQVRDAVGALQLAYRERGFATVSVGLPPQQITNATIQVQVTEGVLSDVRVTGNRHFSSNNVVRALPSLQTNTLLNSRVFQRELDIANQNRDRQIFPLLGPGPEPGTSSLTLRVKDRLPIHGRIELNNQNTPGTPDWRINTSAQHNNLWQLEHQLGLSYGFTPSDFKSPPPSADLLLNRPLIANAGLYYRLPFGAPESVADQLSARPGFGFDEATRQFRLPPAGGRPDLTFFASASWIDTGVQYGPARTVSQTPLLTIVSQDSGQNLSVNESAGFRLNVPLALARTDSRRLSLSAGIDARHFGLQSFNTNNFIITTVVTNAQGSQTIESRVASPQPVRGNRIDYLPLTASIDFSNADRTGNSSASLAVSGNVIGDARNVADLAYSRDADAAFAKVQLHLARDQRLGGGWSLLTRASGQVATGPLLGIEQFSLGGLQSVRGYMEGDEFGDHGWFGSLELRTPFLEQRVPVGSEFAPTWVRAIAFTDAGQRFLDDASTPGTATRTLLASGFGVSANIDNRVDLRIVVGWPFFDTPNTEAGVPRVVFSLGGQF